MSQNRKILERAKDEFEDRIGTGIKRCYVEENQLVVEYDGNPYDYSGHRRELKEEFNLEIVDNDTDPMPIIHYEVKEEE